MTDATKNKIKTAKKCEETFNCYLVTNPSQYCLLNSKYREIKVTNWIFNKFYLLNLTFNKPFCQYSERNVLNPCLKEMLKIIILDNSLEAILGIINIIYKTGDIIGQDLLIVKQ